MIFEKWINKDNILFKNDKKIHISEVKLPLKVAYMSDEDIKDQIEMNYIKTYKALDYYKKEHDELNEREWSNWEVSLMLRCYKSDIGIRVIEPEKTFPLFILNITRLQAKEQIDAIVSVYASRDTSGKIEGLQRKDLYWTPLEVGYILYFLSIYKKDISEFEDEEF